MKPILKRTHREVLAADESAPKKKKAKQTASKTFFLTVAQCDLLPEKALEQWEKVGKSELKEYIIAQEDHEDGGKHLHAYLRYKKKLRVQYDAFTLRKSAAEAEDGVQVFFNAHIVGKNEGDIRSVAAIKKYCKKGGVFIQSESAVAAESLFEGFMEMFKMEGQQSALVWLSKEDPHKFLEKSTVWSKSMEMIVPPIVVVYQEGLEWAIRAEAQKVPKTPTRGKGGPGVFCVGN